MGKPRLDRRLPHGRAVTAFLRVPWSDWVAVTTGAKTELRWTGKATPLPERFQCPEPVVGYTLHPFTHQPLVCLLMIEASWKELLGSIGEESLAREGFDSLDDFRAYWKTRFHHSKREFAPLTQVVAYRVRPYEAGRDRRAMADMLFDRLWGAYEDGEVPEA